MFGFNTNLALEQGGGLSLFQEFGETDILFVVLVLVEIYQDWGFEFDFGARRSDSEVTIAVVILDGDGVALGGTTGGERGETVGVVAVFVCIDGLCRHFLC